jgi:hypothetical protein
MQHGSQCKASTAGQRGLDVLPNARASLLASAPLICEGPRDCMPWSELRHLTLRTRAVLVALLLLYNAFALVRALPVNTGLSENRESNRGTYNRNVHRIFRLAREQAAPPFFDVKNHAIFFDRNPGMFMFVAELFVRAGAATPFPNQLLSILLWNLGLLLLFLWLLHLLESEVAAVAGVAYMTFTPFVLFYSSSIHHEPWCFFFFNLTFYCYVWYLRLGKPRRWLIATCVAYFFLCQNYWFYYVSAGLLFVALQVRMRAFSLRDTLILALVPVIATLTTFLQVMYALGGADRALFRLKDIAAARTVDMRIEHSEWYPDKKFLNAYHWQHYPITVTERIELLAGTSVETFCALLGASVVLAGRRAWWLLSWMLIVVLAGLSWNLMMFQHTVIHHFAGMYGWFMWALIVAVFVDEVRRVIPSKLRTITFVAAAIPLAYFTLHREYSPYLSMYLTNARAGAVVHQTPPRQ